MPQIMDIREAIQLPIAMEQVRGLRAIDHGENRESDSADNDSAMTGQQDARILTKVSLCPFSEGTLQTVNRSFLNEKVARDVHIVTEHRHYIREDKKGSHNKAERHGAIRTGFLFLMPLPTCAKTKYWHCSHKICLIRKKQNNLL